MRKKIIILLLLLLMPITEIYAFTTQINFADTGSGGDGSSDPNPEYSVSLGTTTNGNKTISYECKYTYSTSGNNSVTINGYNMLDQEIMATSLNIADKDRILAGTSLGLNVYESKMANWTVTKAEVWETVTTVTSTISTKYYYNCFYDCTDSNKSFIPGGYKCNVSCPAAQFNVSACSAAPSGCKGSSSTVSSHSSTMTSTTTESGGLTLDTDKILECRTIASTAAREAAKSYLYPSYKLYLPDSNKKDGADHIEIHGSAINYSISDDGTTGSVSADYQYKPKKVCMDVKTAKVRYDETKCTDNLEIEVNDATNHWHYFVPLSTKSGEEINLQFRESGKGKLNRGQCEYVMENNPVGVPETTSYRELIVKLDGTLFDGDYEKKDAGNDYNAIDEGCHLTSIIKIPIVQKFYKETIGNKFKGFNFYYKPIDINNPFPNELAQNSLWREWKINKQANKENPKFSESFNSKTYVALNINANTIRDYNAKIENTKNEITGEYEDIAVNAYTNWQKMNVNGSSQYIEDAANENGIIKRYVDNNSFYNLGCGPANKDWEGCK